METRKIWSVPAENVLANKRALIIGKAEEPALTRPRDVRSNKRFIASFSYRRQFYRATFVSGSAARLSRDA